MNSRLFNDQIAISCLPKFCKHLYCAYRRVGMDAWHAYEKTRASLKIYSESLRYIQVGF